MTASRKEELKVVIISDNKPYIEGQLIKQHATKNGDNYTSVAEYAGINYNFTYSLVTLPMDDLINKVKQQNPDIIIYGNEHIHNEYDRHFKIASLTLNALNGNIISSVERVAPTIIDKRKKDTSVSTMVTEEPRATPTPSSPSPSSLKPKRVGLFERSLERLQNSLERLRNKF